MNTNLKFFYAPIEAPNNKQYFMYGFIINKEKFCLLILLDENKNIYRIDWNTVEFAIGFQKIDLYELIFDLNLSNLIYKIFFETKVLGYFHDSYSEKIFNKIKEAIKEIFNELQIPA